MTTRQDLEREREALRGMIAHGERYGRVTPEGDALRASIARLDALLSLSDAMAGEVSDAIAGLADDEECLGERAYPPRVAAHRTVADLVRRTQR